jgi:hypothetical protein
MAYQPSYTLAVDRQDLIVKFKRDVIDRDALGRFLDYIELESIRKKSQMSEAEAETLSREIDDAVWENIKHLFVEA